MKSREGVGRSHKAVGSAGGSGRRRVAHRKYDNPKRVWGKKRRCGERANGKRRRGGSSQCTEAGEVGGESDGEGEMERRPRHTTSARPDQTSAARSLAPAAAQTTRAKTQGTRREAKRRYKIG